MKDLTNILNNSLNESLVNESRHEFEENSDTPKGILSVGVNYDEDLGVIIGQPFKAGDKSGQRKAEAMVSKLGLKIEYTYDEAFDDAKSNDYDITGELMCYFYIPNSQMHPDVRCESFNNKYECVKLLQ